MPIAMSVRKKLVLAAKAAQKLSVPRPTPAPRLKNARNIFLIRSATPEQFKRCLKQLRLLAPRATLHFVSHQRDAALVESAKKPRDRFYPYPGGGNYSLTGLQSILPRLKKARLDTFVMLSNNVYGYPHISEILSALGARELHLFNINERWYSIGKAELEMKNAASAVYLGICKLLYQYA